MLAGIDVATYQTVAQTTAAVKGGARFVIAKATEGQRSVDARHGGHVAAARAAGALVGHYHFAWLGQSPQAEADHFLATARPQPGDLLALDVEIEHTGAGQWPDVAHRLAYTLAWLAHVKAATGASPVLYSYVSELTALCQQAARVGRLAELTSHPLWVADPGKPAGSPRIASWGVWTLHQHATTGGIDRDVLNGDESTWRALAVPGARPGDFVDRGAAAPVPQPKPAPAPAPAPAPVPHQEDGMPTAEEIAAAILAAPVGGNATDSPHTLATALYRQQSEAMRTSDQLENLAELQYAIFNGDHTAADAAIAKVRARAHGAG